MAYELTQLMQTMLFVLAMVVCVALAISAVILVMAALIIATQSEWWISRAQKRADRLEIERQLPRKKELKAELECFLNDLLDNQPAETKKPFDQDGV